MLPFLKWIPFETQDFSKYRTASNLGHKPKAKLQGFFGAEAVQTKFLVSFGIYISHYESWVRWSTSAGVVRYVGFVRTAQGNAQNLESRPSGKCAQNFGDHDCRGNATYECGSYGGSGYFDDPAPDLAIGQLGCPAELIMNFHIRWLVDD